MTSISNTTTIAQLTWMPVNVLEKPGNLKPDIIVTTPHRGDVLLELTETHYPFIFGSVTQTEKHSSEIIRQLRGLESSAADFLRNQWLKSIKNQGI